MSISYFAKMDQRWKESRERTRLVEVAFGTPEGATEFWRSRQSFFQERGYELEIPKPEELVSTNDTSSDVSHLVNATRVTDGQQICIKHVRSASAEVRLLRPFSKKYSRADPGNHCVPVYEVLRDNQCTQSVYIVMPALRPMDVSAMETVGDVVDFTSQVLLGLNFLHKNNVAHCDCSVHNIKTGARYSPREQKGLSSLPCESSEPSSETKTYYFVGFGGAERRYPQSGYPCFATHKHALDPEPPEMQEVDIFDTGHPNIRSYDPFLLDVFLIGNMLRREFLDKYSNVRFLLKLVKHMVRDKPENRPEADEALQIWLLNVYPHISSRHRRQRLCPRDEWRPDTIIPNTTSIIIDLKARVLVEPLKKKIEQARFRRQARRDFENGIFRYPRSCLATTIPLREST